MWSISNSLLSAGLLFSLIVSAVPKAFGIDLPPACETHCQDSVTAPLYSASCVTDLEATKHMTSNRNGWRGIMPLRSVRRDVERLLGGPTNSLGETYIYESKAERVHVLYAQAPCENTEVGKWNVPVDTVLKLTVYPQRTILVRDLHLSRASYPRTPEAHPENWVHYINDKDGVTVNAMISLGREKVMSFVYEPSKKQERLRCTAPALPSSTPRRR